MPECTERARQRRRALSEFRPVGCSARMSASSAGTLRRGSPPLRSGSGCVTRRDRVVPSVRETAPMAVGSEGVPVDASVWSAPAVFPSDADLLVPPRDRDLTLAWRVLGAVVVVACCALVLWVLHPEPAAAEHHAERRRPRRPRLVPGVPARPPAARTGGSPGWSNDWFGGFPAGQFYFPVPALVTVRPRLVLPVQRRAQAHDRDRSGADAGGRVRVRARASACADRAPSSARSRRSASCSSRASRPARTRRPTQTAIQFNQRIMGGTLVSSLAGEYSFAFALTLALVRARRARVLGAHRPAQGARRGAVRRDGDVARRRRHLRRASARW